MVLASLLSIILILTPSSHALAPSSLAAHTPKAEKSLLPLLPHELQTPHPPHPARLSQTHTRSPISVEGAGQDNMSTNDLQRSVSKKETQVGRGKRMFAQGGLAGLGRGNVAWDLQVEYSGTTFFDG
jgi:hypothetical protein